MKASLNYILIVFEGVRHSALDDALNTAKLFIWMVKKCQNGFLPNVNGGGERK